VYANILKVELQLKSSEITPADNVLDSSGQTMDHLSQPNPFVNSSPPWEKLGFVPIKPSATKELRPLQGERINVRNYVNDFFWIDQFIKVMVFFSFLGNWKEERLLAKKAGMSRVSVGDKIMEILAKDANDPTVSIKKTNAILALDILTRFKNTRNETQEGSRDENTGIETEKQDWKAISKEMHEVDVNPHILAVRWLVEYATFWWVHFRWRWELRKAELLNSRGRKK
jgi:hypothetical protein